MWNIFTNNYIKEHCRKNSGNKNNFKTVAENDYTGNASKGVADNYKTLEQRVIELEKELRMSKLFLLIWYF